MLNGSLLDRARQRQLLSYWTNETVYDSSGYTNDTIQTQWFVYLRQSRGQFKRYFKFIKHMDPFRLSLKRAIKSMQTKSFTMEDAIIKGLMIRWEISLHTIPVHSINMISHFLSFCTDLTYLFATIQSDFQCETNDELT